MCRCEQRSCRVQKNLCNRRNLRLVIPAQRHRVHLSNLWAVKRTQRALGCGLGLRDYVTQKSVPLTRATRILNTIFISAISKLALPNTLLGFAEYFTWLRRIRAAARQSSSKLGSALALHLTSPPQN